MRALKPAASTRDPARWSRQPRIAVQVQARPRVYRKPGRGRKRTPDKVRRWQVSYIPLTANARWARSPGHLRQKS
jgi:hypothetical protein